MICKVIIEYGNLNLPSKLFPRQVQNYQIIRLDKTNEQSNQNQLIKILNETYRAATFSVTFESSPHFFLTQQNRNKALKYDGRDLRDKVARLKQCKYHMSI